MKIFSRLDWTSVIFITLFHGGFLALTPIYFMTHSWNWTAFGIAGGLYILAAFGITAGYHRYFSHKTYQIHPILEIMYLILGCMGFAGSAATWSADHRVHHAKTDTLEDPYSIKRGFWYAHMGWFLLKRPKMDPTKIPDLWSSKWVRFQHRYYVWIAAFLHISFNVIGGIFFDGFASLYFFSLFWMFFFHHTMFSINSLAHTWGSKTYAKELTAVDNFFLAFFTFGEGYHNYHHAFPNDYRNGIAWYHFDPTKWLIWILEKLHLAKNLRSKDGLLIRANLMQKDFALIVHTLSEKLPDLHLREKITARFAKIKEDFERKTGELHQELKIYSELLKEKKTEAIRLKKMECLHIQKELKLHWERWKDMIHYFDHEYVLIDH